jgi:hypothetical protein
LLQKNPNHSKNNLEKQCEKLISQGNKDKAVILASGIQTIISDLETCDRNILKLASSVKEATSLVGMCESELIQLRMEKKNVVENLKLDSELLKTYNSLDELRKDTNAQKMLGYAREGSKEKREQAVGARVVHESKASTQIQDAVKTAQSVSAMDYIEEMERKMKNKSTTSAFEDSQGFEVKEQIKNKN